MLSSAIPKALRDETKINLVRNGKREFSELVEEFAGREELGTIRQVTTSRQRGLSSITVPLQRAIALSFTTVCRTLDVLHVAAAKLIGTKDLCIFDTRQSTLAGRV